MLFVNIYAFQVIYACFLICIDITCQIKPVIAELFERTKIISVFLVTEAVHVVESLSSGLQIYSKHPIAWTGDGLVTQGSS